MTFRKERTSRVCGFWLLLQEGGQAIQDRGPAFTLPLEDKRQRKVESDPIQKGKIQGYWAAVSMAK